MLMLCAMDAMRVAVYVLPGTGGDDTIYWCCVCGQRAEACIGVEGLTLKKCLKCDGGKGCGGLEDETHR